MYSIRKATVNYSASSSSQKKLMRNINQSFNLGMSNTTKKRVGSKKNSFLGSSKKKSIKDMINQEYSSFNTPGKETNKKENTIILANSTEKNSIEYCVVE